ncbi:TRAP transporter large permease [Oceanobacillus caeni]|uniref:TRAP transporter large permease n=1 Tax=Oceanobacillus caeni TaxID=405946 RepID=UPI001C2180A9|nr:TRAP transporter large permease [Oceanobacillus caeni]MBU8790259.1 TRAP transporter large permease [Oceanobacillus caeni]
MASIVLFGTFGLLLLISVPIGVALILSSLLTLIYSGILPLEFISQSLITSVDSFPIMAVPFFILAGEIMGKGGISRRLFNTAESMLGNKTGGIAMATIVTCMFFASISGSGPATVAAIGGIMIPEMVRIGYDKRFATSVVASAGALGVIIPPSIPMIMYGVTGGVSVGDLFIAGVIPGILIGIGLMIYSYFYSKKQGYTGNGIPFSFKRFFKSIWDAKWSLVMPFIIIGGIYGGIFTPTEAGVVAVVFGLIVSLMIYKEIKLKELPKIIADSAMTTATILFIIGTATAFGQLMTIEHIPTRVTEAILSVSDNTLILTLLIMIILLIVGCFMDTTAAIIILVPLLLPIVTELGFDPVHFGVVMIANLAIGFITPPLGVNLFVASGISGISILPLSKALIPFFFVMLITLGLILFIPQLSLLLLGS